MDRIDERVGKNFFRVLYECLYLEMFLIADFLQERHNAISQ